MVVYFLLSDTISKLLGPKQDLFAMVMKPFSARNLQTHSHCARQLLSPLIYHKAIRIRQSAVIYALPCDLNNKLSPQTTQELCEYHKAHIQGMVAQFGIILVETLPPEKGVVTIHGKLYSHKTVHVICRASLPRCINDLTDLQPSEGDDALDQHIKVLKALHHKEASTHIIQMLTYVDDLQCKPLFYIVKQDWECKTLSQYLHQVLSSAQQMFTMKHKLKCILGMIRAVIYAHSKGVLLRGIHAGSFLMRKADDGFKVVFHDMDSPYVPTDFTNGPQNNVMYIGMFIPSYTNTLFCTSDIQHTDLGDKCG